MNTNDQNQYMVTVSPSEAFRESFAAFGRSEIEYKKAVLGSSILAALIPIVAVLSWNFLSGGAAESVAWQKILKQVNQEKEEE